MLYLFFIVYLTTELIDFKKKDANYIHEWDVISPFDAAEKRQSTLSLSKR